MNLELRRIHDTPVTVVFSEGLRIGAFNGNIYHKEGSYTHWMQVILDKNHADTLKVRMLGEENRGG